MTAAQLAIGADTSDETGTMIADSAATLFAQLGTLSNPVGAAANAGEFDAEAWRAVREAGFPAAMLPEALGGVGPVHAFAIARLAGAAALALPLIETLGANWLLAQAGLPPEEHPITFSDTPVAIEQAAGGWRVRGQLARVPWARASHLVAVAPAHDGLRLVLLDRQSFAFVPGANLAGEPRDRCTIDVVVGDDRIATLPPAVTGITVRGLGAALRAAQMAGAMAAAVDMTAAYARNRKQFGKPIAAFQAIQQMLATMATVTAAARAAAEIAAQAFVADPDWRPLAVAKIRSGEAAGTVAAMAHQIHGAIGFTQEYPLQLLVRRLWSWRDEFGSEAEWAVAFGHQLAAGKASLWSQLTSI